MGRSLSSAAAARAGGALLAHPSSRLARGRVVFATWYSGIRHSLLSRPPPTHATRACSDAFGGRWKPRVVHGDHAARGRTRDSARASVAPSRAVAPALRRIEHALSRSLSPAASQQAIRSAYTRLVRAESSG